MKLGIASLIGVLLSATPALATPETVSETELNAHGELVVLINKLGVDILFDHPFVCQQKRWFGAYATDGSELILCENSKATQGDRLRTIRHEAWHVYQDLKDCKLTDQTPISPIFAPGKVPPLYLQYASRSYPKPEVPAEAEAYWAEDSFTPDQISTLITQQAKRCSYRL